MLPFMQQAKPNIGSISQCTYGSRRRSRKRNMPRISRSRTPTLKVKHYKDWGAEGYVMVGHEELCAEMNDKVHPSLLLWWKNDPKCEPIITIAGSYTEAEENF